MERLSRREKEVCEKLCLGWKNKEVAQHLGISRRTAEDHRKHIFKKYEVHNAVELVREVYQLADEVPA